MEAGVEEELGRGVVELIGLHRAHQGDAVGDPLEVGQQLRDLLSVAAVATELVWGAQDLWSSSNEGEGLALEQFLRAGDIVELGVEGLGTQRQPVVAYRA